MTSVSNTTAQIKVSPASGASNANSKINFQGTFFNYPADIGARLTATIKSGFSTGVWGTEYLDILVNNAANDISSEANQNRVVRVTKGDVDVTGNIITSGGIELGNASDTTIARSAAGVITVEGVEVVTLSRTQTLTNKTLTSPTLTTPALGLATGTSVMLSANIGAAAGNVSGNFTAGNFQTTGAINAASGTISSATGRIIFGTDAGGAISLGNVSNLGASTPFLDFNSGATTVDYDSRIMGSGGNGVSGNGTLTFTSATAAFTGNVTAVNSNFTGNVGFGVSTVPAGSRVAVAGTLGISETGGSGGRLQITSTSGGAVIFQNDNSPIIFKTQSGTQEKMRISDNGNVEITGNVSVSGVSRLGNVTTGNILPSSNNIQSIGSPTNRFKDLYLSGNTIFLGNIILSDSDGTIQVSDTQGNVVFSGIDTSGFNLSTSTDFPGRLANADYGDLNSITADAFGVPLGGTVFDCMEPIGRIISADLEVL